ncbi:subtilisin-like protein [Mollisia scopiformis]|uniref:Subtilisin-like protein n=1 Tax=Mollisia scopiformis TaxID=149040 RepID=A0A194XJ87_MOLSC|nr:subtilisin-like protein [Mollisia scopiformis]KUJ20186.1 subtilisin-like protein [Mollisia scopiformis]
MRFLNLGLVFGFAAIASAAAIPHTHAVHEKRDTAVAKKWEKRGRLSANARLPMRIGLKQRNLHLGHDLLMDISDPSSPNYSKHWTSEEVIEMFAPEQKTVDAVRAWLIDSGIAPQRLTHSDNKGWLAFDATTEEAETLLLTEYHLYEHVDGQTTAACESYHVPKYIQEHLDYITPGIKLSAPSKRSVKARSASNRIHSSIPFQRATDISTNDDLSQCYNALTPACLRALYGFPETPEYPGGQARTDNSLGIFEEGDFYDQADLDTFFANFTPYIPQGTHPVPAFIDGAQAPVPQYDAGPESDLDLQLSYPIIYPQNVTLFQTDDLYSAYTSRGFLNTFLDAIDGSYCTYSAFGETGNDPIDPVYPDTVWSGGYKGQLMCGVYEPTNVISVSYGGSEADWPTYYQQRQCNEYMKLGLQGTSIFFASGDAGVAGRYGDGNVDGCLGTYGQIFSPGFPTSCPYVTSVGATQINPNSTVYEPESVADYPDWGYSSGGGFSNIYPVPSYQHSAVYDYLQRHDPGYKYYRGNVSLATTDGLYNRSGRGYPDVSANGWNLAVVIGGETGVEGGTSAATPIWASLINRINEQRLNIGKKTLGFLNPALYANPHVLNDITTGSNPGCATKGFPAATGWDPATGLGTPNYPKMLDYFLSLP